MRGTLLPKLKSTRRCFHILIGTYLYIFYVTYLFCQGELKDFEISLFYSKKLCNTFKCKFSQFLIFQQVLINIINKKKLNRIQEKFGDTIYYIK